MLTHNPEYDHPRLYRPRVRPIGLQKLREQSSEFARRVRNNEEFIVYRYGEPMFRIIRPYDHRRVQALRQSKIWDPEPEPESLW